MSIFWGVKEMVGSEGGGRNSKISSREGEEGRGCHATFTVEFSQKGKAYRFRSVPFALDRSVPVGSERGQGPLHGSFFSALVHLLSASSLADTLSLLQRTKSFTSLKLNSTVVVTSKIGIRNLLHHQDCSFQSISTPFLRFFFRCELTFLPPSLPSPSYLLSLFLPLPCTPSLLRLTNLLLLFTLPFIINHLLSQRRSLKLSSNSTTGWGPSVESIAISLFPPLWFFSNIYYTDVGSCVFVLASWAAARGGRNWLSSGVSPSLSSLFSLLHVDDFLFFPPPLELI